MRRSASETIRNLEMRIARLERKASTNRQAGEKIDVQIEFRESWKEDIKDVFIYFQTDDENLAQMISDYFDRTWKAEHPRTSVSMGHYSDRRQGIDLSTVDISIRSADVGSVGQRGYLKNIEKAFNKIDRGGFKFRVVRQIQR